jgi:DNA-directed RNA polymerase subunit RPC12/RpoP
MRCAALHELDLEDRELPCVKCRHRAAELYPIAQ